VQPTSWDEFTARKAAPETSEEPDSQLKPLAGNKRQGHSLASLLLQAIQLAGTRRGRLSQAERIREQTLLEVLTTSMRR
jgi:hypothetical protein